MLLCLLLTNLGLTCLCESFGGRAYGGLAEWEGKAMQPTWGKVKNALSRKGVQMPDKVRMKTALEALGSPAILLPRNTQVDWNKEYVRQEQFMAIY